MKFKFIINIVPLLFFFTFSPTNARAQDTTQFSRIQVSWADSVLATLSLDEKIAQLLMVRAYSNKDNEHYSEIEELVTKYNIGGLCFFQGGPVRQAKLTNRYQENAKTPLFIAIDAEWGLGMRLDSCFSFPYQMTLGAMDNDSLVYEMSSGIARQLKLIGVHINFAPVVDINNNPKNPVINSRSFGENRESVARNGIAYMKGQQDNGIIATAKHFPGHGDTDADSHKTLPIVPHSFKRLDSLELYPFKRLVKAGLDAVMIAHLYIPELDSTPQLASTLSERIVTGLLKAKLGFEGLVVTDALDMQGVAKYFGPGEVELKAFEAGNDILLLPRDIPQAIKKIREAVNNGIISDSAITERCGKVLAYKQKAGLDHYSPVNTGHLYDSLKTINNELISRKIYKSAITLVRNSDNLLPLRNLDTLNIATLAIGDPEVNPFQQMLGNYDKLDNFNIHKSITKKQTALLQRKLSAYNLILVGIHNTSIFPNKNFGIDPGSLEVLKSIDKKTKVVLVLFGSPYALGVLPDEINLDAIMCAYQDNRIANEIAAQMVMGGMDCSGTLPVSAGKDYPLGTGLQIKSIQRFQYAPPEEVGIPSKKLKDIDSIVLDNIHKKAIPGCQILIAKDGKVIYNKSFGYHTYHKGNFVKNSDLYDLASITKVAATTLSVMKLSDEGRLDIDQPLVTYLPYLKGTNKEHMVIRELMAHQARLKPWIPFYMFTLNDKKQLDTNFYCKQIKENYTVKVANELYIREDYKYTMFDSITFSGLRKRKDYKYSDLGFYYLKEIIENVTNQPFDRYVTNTFYKELGLSRTAFNPLNNFMPKEIVPTENDNYFRHQLVHGHVHDPGAAMLGGVSGHAGLFTNAGDLAVIMQMLLQKGEYGGKRYIAESTVGQFTKRQFPLNNNRRGIGFDKPNVDDREHSPSCDGTSANSFGHSGFTGTYTWVDPDENLIYIFLSNRINPTAKNTKLIKMDTRTKIHQLIYDALPEKEKTNDDFTNQEKRENLN